MGSKSTWTAAITETVLWILFFGSIMTYYSSINTAKKSLETVHITYEKLHQDLSQQYLISQKLGPLLKKTNSTEARLKTLPPIPSSDNIRINLSFYADHLLTHDSILKDHKNKLQQLKEGRYQLAVYDSQQQRIQISTARLNAHIDFYNHHINSKLLQWLSFAHSFEPMTRFQTPYPDIPTTIAER